MSAPEPSRRPPDSIPPVVVPVADLLALIPLVACASLMLTAYLPDVCGVRMHPLALAGTAIASAAIAGARVRTTWSIVETVAFLGVWLIGASYLLWLASPSLLPVTVGPDVVHHLQLIHVIARTGRLPHDPALQPYLLEMMNYTPGGHVLAYAVAAWLRIDALRVIQPIAAVLTGLKVATLYLLAYRVGNGSRAAATAALAAPALVFVPAVYTLGSFFHFFFYSQIVSEAFAFGMLLAVLRWSQQGTRWYLAVFAACGVGVFLSWPVWLGPSCGALLFALVRAPIAWRVRAAAAAGALIPIVLVASLHSLLHAEGGRILTSAGAVTTPSIAAFGPAFIVCAALGAIASLRLHDAQVVVFFLLLTIAQALVLKGLAAAAGSASLYMPFKMVYLMVPAAAVLGGVALIAVAGVCGRRVAVVTASIGVVLASVLAFGRVPHARPASPINEPAYAAGLWARDHLDRGCVDYFTSHWLTGYWLHLDVLGNPRLSDRMRGETFEFRDSVGAWLEGRGRRYGIVEHLSDIPRDLRPDLRVLRTFGSAAIIESRARCGV